MLNQAEKDRKIVEEYEQKLRDGMKKVEVRRYLMKKYSICSHQTIYNIRRRVQQEQER